MDWKVNQGTGSGRRAADINTSKQEISEFRTKLPKHVRDDVRPGFPLQRVGKFPWQKHKCHSLLT